MVESVIFSNWKGDCSFGDYVVFLVDLWFLVGLSLGDGLLVDGNVVGRGVWRTEELCVG